MRREEDGASPTTVGDTLHTIARSTLIVGAGVLLGLAFQGVGRCAIEDQRPASQSGCKYIEKQKNTMVNVIKIQWFM